MDAIIKYHLPINHFLCLGVDVKLTLKSRPNYPPFVRATVVPPIDEVKHCYHFQYDNTNELNITESDILCVEPWDYKQDFQQLEQRYLNLLTFLNIEELPDGSLSNI